MRGSMPKLGKSLCTFLYADSGIEPFACVPKRDTSPPLPNGSPLDLWVMPTRDASPTELGEGLLARWVMPHSPTLAELLAGC